MDCADVVIGQARGDLFRVFDYYTRDRASPRRDEFYGGDDDITAAVGEREQRNNQHQIQETTQHK